jgi:uncharacterized membrane protein YccF (DUF307 family)
VRTILNLIWLILSGFWLALAYAFAGVIMCVLVITIPFGSRLVLPRRLRPVAVRQEVIRRPGAGAASMVGNVLWFLLAGVWIAVAHVLLGLILCLTIVGIPLGLGNFKLAAVAIAPLDKEIVSTSDPRAALGAVSF